MLQFWDLVQKTYIKKTFQIGSCLFNLHQMNSLILCIFFIASMLREMNSGSSITCDDHQKPSAQSEAVNQYCLHVGLHLVIPNSEFKRRALTAKEAAYFKKFNHDGIIGPGNNNNNNNIFNNIIIIFKGLLNVNTRDTYVKQVTYYRWIPFTFLFLVRTNYNLFWF